MSCGMVRFKLLVSLAGFSIFSVDRMLSVKSCVDQIYVQRRTPEPNLYHLLTRGTVPRYPIYCAASFKGASYCWPQKQHWKKIENGYPCNLVDGSWFFRCSAIRFVTWALAAFPVHRSLTNEKLEDIWKARLVNSGLFGKSKGTWDIRNRFSSIFLCIWCF